MNSELTVLMILQKKNLVSIHYLIDETGFSERKIREVLRSIRHGQEKHGFELTTINKRGYILQISDNDRFMHYIHELDQDGQESGNREYRELLIIFLLLQNEEYISLNQVSDLLEVSRSTITNDLKNVRSRLEKYNIDLQSKQHYGVKVIGEEKSIRNALSSISRDIENYQRVPVEFFDFIAKLDFTEESKMFVSLLNEYNIYMTKKGIESVLFHLKILIYRVQQENYIMEIGINRDFIDPVICEIAHKIARFIEDKYLIHITTPEIDLVASQMFGKSRFDDVLTDKKQSMVQSIQHSLKRVDADFDMSFSEDSNLKENLLYHIYPLLMRVTYGLSLSDSLVKSVSVQYMNAFLVAMRFIDYHKELRDYNLSRDEIGYIALHFAVHIEKENQKKFEKIKTIALVVDDKRSSSMLLGTKLKSLFPFATIREVPHTLIHKHTFEDVNLILSTVPIENKILKKKTILIENGFDESSIRRIKNEILLREIKTSETVLSLNDLFFEDIFMVRKTGDYLALVTEISNVMIKTGYAQEGFTESVIERETRFSTIYDNGIAAPHSLNQLANIDSIGVILLENTILYQEKLVSAIFVINVKKGHLLIHQEIGDLILRLMEDRSKVKILQRISTFQKFVGLMQDIL